MSQQRPEPVISDELHIRELDREAPGEIEWVAQRMRQTLVEVLGERRGTAMYSSEWLVERVKWHLDPSQVVGQVFLAETSSGELKGHAIVRIDDDGEGNRIGLFSTTYVMPDARNHGVATRLLERGEQWMLGHGLAHALTYTDQDNTKLQKLYTDHGYTVTPMPRRFVKLAKPLSPSV